MKKDIKKFAIIDTFALLHRAWHAIPNLTTKDGTMVNAAYGFSLILLKLINELKPDYIVAAFDLPHETFRKKEYREYKAQREAPDKDFINQIPLIENILKALNIPKLAVPGYEADDVIGSLAHHYSAQGVDVMIVSGDLDTLQLVNGRTRVFTMRKGINDTTIYDAAAVKDRYGIAPKQIIDLKAIAGDSSDNIPGVRGIGEKGALGLLHEFGTLEKIYESIDSKKIKDRTRELLKEHKDMAFQSKRLATIVTDLPITMDLVKAETHDYDTREITKLFQKLEFRSLLSKLPPSNNTIQPQKKTISKETYRVIDSEDGVRALASELKNVRALAIDTETTGLNPRAAEILGASIAWGAGDSVFIHLRDDALRRAFKQHIAPVLTEGGGALVGHNIKFDYEVLRKLGITPAPPRFDTLIAAYLVNSERSLKLEDLAFTYLGKRMQNLSELAAETLTEKITKKGDIPVEKIDPSRLAQYGAADADMTFRLYQKLSRDLEKESFSKLFHEIEMPLVPILVEMESTGILIDTGYLRQVEKKTAQDIKTLEKKIHHHAGSDFNIGSPLQLKEVLFNKLNIATKGIKRKKTGLSTAADELEKLQDAHPIIPLIQDWRELTKLMNTYITTLPKLVDPHDKRIHTNYNQTVAATGRLSSSDPNLQNIPVRTELGRAIRKAFVASPGHVLISADYSQIELRLAAIISHDKKMLASFKAGEDIHRRTAAEVHGVPLENVTSDQRRQAKEVNFGVLYGLGSVGLAQRTGMSRLEAKQFIERYFELYKGVAEYIQKTKSFAHTNGYAETLFGRRRTLPGIKAANPMLIAQAERMAVNMPLQGTAADIMKLAMICCATDVPREAPSAHMLLQVHDELVFEVKENEKERAARQIKKSMEAVAHYEIPLIADVGAGNNWADLTDIPL